MMALPTHHVHALLAVVATILLASCSRESPPAPERDQTAEALTSPAAGTIERAAWQLHAGPTSYEGDLAYVSRTGDGWHVQLVNTDAVNLALRFGAEGTGSRPLDRSFFAVGRGQPCHLVASEPAPQVTLEPATSGVLTGTFAGMLGCPGASALPMSGSFTAPVSEARP